MRALIKAQADGPERNDHAGANTPQRQGLSEKEPADQGRKNNAGFPQRSDRAYRPKGECRDHSAIGMSATTPPAAAFKVSGERISSVSFPRNVTYAAGKRVP